MTKTLQQKLDAMNTKYTVLFIYSGHYPGTKYHASIEYAKDKEKFKLQSEEYDTINQAVDELYTKFCQVTNGEAFRSALPPLLTTDYYEVPKPLASQLDDEIPF